MNRESRQPLVSIGLPVFNAERYVARALDCLRRQNYPNIEIIISDNASTDSTYSICESFAAKESKITLSRNSYNLGVNANYEIVRKRAAGEYFMWGAADDEWEPDYVSSLVSELQSAPTISVAASCVKYIDSDGDEIGQVEIPCLKNMPSFSLATKILTPYTHIKNQKFNLIRCGIIRKRVLDDMLDACPQLLDAGDRPFLTMLVLAGGARSVSRFLYRKRLHREGSFRRRNPTDPIAHSTSLSLNRPTMRMMHWALISKSHTLAQKMAVWAVCVRFEVLAACLRLKWMLLGALKSIFGNVPRAGRS